jgi:hypothetical protein
MYTSDGEERDYVVRKRDKKKSPLLETVDACASSAALAITESLTRFGGVHMCNMFTKEEFGLLTSSALGIFQSAKGETTVGPHGARRSQIKLAHDKTRTYEELQAIIDALQAAVSRLRAAGMWYITEEHRVYWVSLVSDAVGGASDGGQLFHSERNSGKSFAAALPLVLHIPLTTDGSMLDILPGSHFGMAKYKFRGASAPMARVDILQGQVFMHISDLMHAGAGRDGSRAHKRMVVLLLSSQDRAFKGVNERDEVVLPPVANSAAKLKVSSKPIDEPLPAASEDEHLIAEKGVKGSSASRTRSRRRHQASKSDHPASDAAAAQQKFPSHLRPRGAQARSSSSRGGLDPSSELKDPATYAKTVLQQDRDEEMLNVMEEDMDCEDSHEGEDDEDVDKMDDDEEENDDDDDREGLAGPTQPGGSPGKQGRVGVRLCLCFLQVQRSLG